MYYHVCDEFLPDADEVRKKILSAPFKGVEFQGHFYKGIEADRGLVPKELIERAIGQPVKVNYSFFRLSKPGEETPASVHADITMGSSYAAVLYLTPEGDGGTAFWRHLSTNTQGISAKVFRAVRNGDDVSEHADYLNTLHKDSNDEEKWSMQSMLKFEYNRFVSYPANYFHSRYPFKSDSFGKSKSAARLIWVAFYDIVK